MTDTFLLTLTPRQLPALRGWRATPALLAYRLGPGPHLLRADGVVPPRGALMVVGDGAYDGLGQSGPLCQELLGECRSRGLAGAVLDFDRRLPPLEAACARLDDLFSRRGLALYVPEGYASAAPHGRVMIPSALSGGSLELRLEEAGERFGPDRVVLALELRREDFPLPSPTGGGKPLSREELEALKRRLSPSVFFSRELCARYFTYMDGEGTPHFVLFDDGDTLARKVEVARRAGVHTFLAPWTQIAPFAGRLGIPRLQAPEAGGERRQRPAPPGSSR